MALINCPECQKEISNQAKACPNCGCPIDLPTTVTNNVVQPQVTNETGNAKEKKSKSNIMAGFALLFFPLGFLGLFLSFFGIIWACVELADKQIKKKGWAIAALIIFIMTLFLSIASMNSHSKPSSDLSVSHNETSLTQVNSKRITKENYDLIHEGMTEEEVFNILGEPSSISESDTPDVGKTILKHYQEFLGSIGIDIYFLNNTVYMKNYTEF